MTAPLPAWLEAFRRRLGAEVVETHISWLLLAGDTAWKLKKPVTLPFLDYGTPALRRHFEIDAECTVYATLEALSRQGAFDRGQLPQALKDLGIDPDKVAPRTA